MYKRIWMGVIVREVNKLCNVNCLKNSNSDMM